MPCLRLRFWRWCPAAWVAFAGLCFCVHYAWRGAARSSCAITCRTSWRGRGPLRRRRRGRFAPALALSGRSPTIPASGSGTVSPRSHQPWRVSLDVSTASRSPAGPSAIRRATAASTAVRSSTPICSLDVPAPCPATCTGSHRAPASSRSSPVVGPRDARPTRRTMYAALASHAAALASVPSHSPAPPLATPSAARWSPSAPPAHGVAAASRRSALHGSSPRARGTQPSVRYRLVAPWFIPAYAGNTRAATCSAVAPSVHRRVRGEHLANMNGLGRAIGSSPHARARPCRAPRRQTVLGLPTRATPPQCLRGGATGRARGAGGPGGGRKRGSTTGVAVVQHRASARNRPSTVSPGPSGVSTPIGAHAGSRTSAAPATRSRRSGGGACRAGPEPQRSGQCVAPRPGGSRGSDTLGPAPHAAGPPRPAPRHRVAARAARAMRRRGGRGAHPARNRQRATRTERRATPRVVRPVGVPPPPSQLDDSPSALPTQDGA